MRAILLCLSLLFLRTVGATDRFYRDIRAGSPSGRFLVTASSPDNVQRPGQAAFYKPFQSRFTYKCVDTTSGKVVWTRRQAMEKPDPDSDPNLSFQSPKEASPVAIYVSDRGSTVIRTAWDDLIFVSPAGKDVGTLDIYEDGFTAEENERYVHWTTAGRYWGRYSAWYFLHTSSASYFVFRPWWGRRIIMRVSDGKLATKVDAKLLGMAERREAQLVLACLRSEKEPPDDAMSPMEGAYLAGVLNVPEAVPLLRRLEMSNYSGTSTFGGFGKLPSNEVDPHNYSTYDLRQVAQLSLRRLDETPKPLPCHRFELTRGGKSTPFFPPERKEPRHHRADSIKVGFGAKKVLSLIGSPDFVSSWDWSYDMDADMPFSLTLTFDEQKVTSIRRDPPLWKSGRQRDEQLAY